LQERDKLGQQVEAMHSDNEKLIFELQGAERRIQSLELELREMQEYYSNELERKIGSQGKA